MLTVEQISKIWNISGRRVRELCSNGLVPGVQKVGRNYLIPDDAINPKETKTKIDTSGKSKVLVVVKDGENFLAQALAYNFIINEVEVWCNTVLPPLSKNHRIKKLTPKSAQSNSYVAVVFVDTFNTQFCFANIPTVYIGKKPINNKNVLQITNYNLVDKNSLTYFGKMLYAKEGTVKQIYNFINLKINNQINLPVCISLNNQLIEPSLVERFPSIQKSYEFLTEQFDSFDETDEYTNIALANAVEYTDSNQELNYSKSIINSLINGVKVNYVYLFDKENLSKICNHFTTRLYAQKFNKNSAIYMVDKAEFTKCYPEYLAYVNEGIIYYAGKGVYHDDINEFSLGYVNATFDDLNYSKKVAETLLRVGTKITNLKELEAFYGLHK